MTRSFARAEVLTASVLASPVPVAGQQPAPSGPPHDVNALAKATRNPVGDLISVPLQFNFNTGGDLEDRTAKPGAVIWGVGPMLSFPTATMSPAETGTWAAGVGGVVLKMTGPWVLGGLVNQFWPMTDEGGDPETNLFVFQPFVNCNFGHGWALSFSPLVTAR